MSGSLYSPEHAGPTPAQRIAIRQSELFSSWPQSAVDALVEASEIKVLEDGQALHQPGEATRYLDLIVAGCLRLSVKGRDGRDFTIWLHFAGDFHGLGPAALGLTYTNTATARGQTHLVRIPGAVVRSLVSRDGRLAFPLLAGLDRRRKNVTGLHESAATLSTSVRVALLLQGLIERQGAGRSQIELSQEEIGAMLGTRRQVINRALRELKSRGLLRVNYGRVSVADKEALKVFLAAPAREDPDAE
ncbi:MAG: Crp/Fnr family transcriptional regulator [Rubrivivax sp.]